MLEEALVVCAAESRVDGSLQSGQLWRLAACQGQAGSRTEHAVCMRAMEPCRVCMRSGWGRRSLILDCSVDGPRGAKPWEPASAEAEEWGESLSSPALPWPSAAISGWRCIVVMAMTVTMMTAEVEVEAEGPHLRATAQAASRGG